MLLSLYLLFMLLVCKPLESWSSSHRCGSYWGQLLYTNSFIPQRSPRSKRDISVWEGASPSHEECSTCWALHSALAQKMRCLEFASFLPIFTVSKHLHSYDELHLLLFAYCFIFLILAQVTLKYINQHNIFLPQSPKKQNPPHKPPSPPKKSLKFQAVFSLANGLSLFFQRSFQVHQTVCSSPHSDCSSCALHWC